MDNTAIEASYGLDFRHEDIKTLEEHLQLHHSVELIGMKRVGINNFLRFFLTHKNISQDRKHLYVFVDLNALIERELFPFWRLLFKRIADAVENSSLDTSTKKQINTLFDACIQSGDLFLTYDGVRESLHILAKADVSTIIFLTRFDRLKDVVTHEFFDNLQGLKDAAAHRLSFVFTSFRELEKLAPEVFHRKSLSTFSSIQYIKPAVAKDMKVILKTFEQKYNLAIDEKLSQELITLTGGHVQYLQLSLIILYESRKKEATNDLIDAIEHDERITLQSEELWESLTNGEQEVLRKVLQGEKFTQEEKEQAKYLWDTGFIMEKHLKASLFSPLFANYLHHISQQEKTNGVLEFTKKEHMLFSLLKNTPNEICEREKIIEIVWPEYKDYGVSDWSVDKLVARVRGKLKKQKSPYQIVTVKTRGYKLIAA